MKRLREFLITTVIGGVVVVLPIVIIVWVVRIIIRLVAALLAPVVNLIELEVPTIVINLIAIAGIIAACFIIGLFVRTRVGGAIYGYIEKQWFEKIPVYGSIRSIVQQFTGRKKPPFTDVVIVSPFGRGTEMTGFVTDEDGDNLTIFVPTAPNPTNGFVFHVKRANAKYVDVRTEDAMRTIVGMGVGSQDLMKKTIGKRK